MIVKKIDIEDKSDFEFVQRIYVESFPPNERRPLPEFEDLIASEKSFKVNVIFEDDKQVGFITHWDFDTFIYVEHFAISAEYRNGGYGRKVMESFLAETTLPIVLEVELPNDEIAKRRIAFYERIGFKSWEIAYEQPPYEAKYKPLPMMLMTHGNIDLKESFNLVKNSLYKKVYKAI